MLPPSPLGTHLGLALIDALHDNGRIKTRNLATLALFESDFEFRAKII
jgi:hypothetical protein